LPTLGRDSSRGRLGRTAARDKTPDRVDRCLAAGMLGGEEPVVIHLSRLPRSRWGNGIPERGGVVNPCFPACLGCGSAASGQRRVRVGSTRSARSEARTNGVEATRGRRTLSSCRLVPALEASMKLWPASVSMSRSMAARGCQAFLRDDGGRMKPWDVSLWGQGVVGPITYSTAPWWVMPLPGPHEDSVVTQLPLQPRGPQRGTALRRHAARRRRPRASCDPRRPSRCCGPHDHAEPAGRS
jgi:hypothetical protein